MRPARTRSCSTWILSTSRWAARLVNTATVPVDNANMTANPRISRSLTPNFHLGIAEPIPHAVDGLNIPGRLHVGFNLPAEIGDVDIHRARLAEVHPVFANIGEVTPAEWEAFGIEGDIESAPFKNPITDFYLTDVISRASETMAECTAAARGDDPEKTGTDG